jgi:WD40 repeat protein
VLAAGVVLSVAACDDGKEAEPVVSGPTGPLTVSSVVVNPNVATPGDTLLVTAVITSTAPNEGDFPVMDWTATAGSFVEDNAQTVRWVAPATSGTCTITARATNHVNSASGATTVFVGGIRNLIARNAGQVTLVNGGPDFRYFYTTDVSRGVDVHQLVGGVESDPILPGLPPQPRPAQNVTYSADAMMVTWAADTVVAGASVLPRNVYVGNLASGSYTRITRDGAKPLSPERNRQDNPSFSPNAQVVAYQRLAQSWDGIATDSFHVYIKNLVTQERTLVTYEHQFPRGVFPTFSTDGNWLVYLLDRQRNGTWEIYGSPMTGNEVDGSLASLKRFTNTGNQIATGGPRDVKRPVMSWNPVSSILAVAAANGVLYLVETNPTGANAIEVFDVTRALELVWSPDGSQLAAVFTVTEGTDTYSRITTVTPSGVATVRLTAPEGDGIRDLAFSPDASWLLYRVTRGGGSWFNVLDIAGGQLTEPVAVTTTDPAGDAGAYRNVMSLSPRWTNENKMIYPAFTDDPSRTPGIFERDLGSLGD